MANLKVTSNELISIDALRVNTAPAVVTGNFLELNAWLDGLLADKTTVVTLDTLQDEKKELANLRKLAKEIDGKAKAVVALVSGDIDGFARSMKELKAKVLAVAEDKAAQVEEFENATRDRCLALLDAERVQCWQESRVESEFCRADIADLVKLTAMTAAGALTAAAKTAVKDRVQADLRLQTNTKARLMELENKCLKNEINPPLTRASVEAFLFADDATYYSRLDALVDAEISRKAEAEARMRAKLEADKQREIEQALAAQKAQLQAEVTATSEPPAAIAALEATPEQAKPIPADAVECVITAIVKMKVLTKPGADREAIKRHYTKRLQEEGKEVVSVQVKMPEVAHAA